MCEAARRCECERARDCVRVCVRLCGGALEAKCCHAISHRSSPFAVRRCRSDARLLLMAMPARFQFKSFLSVNLNFHFASYVVQHVYSGRSQSQSRLILHVLRFCRVSAEAALCGCAAFARQRTPHHAVWLKHQQPTTERLMYPTSSKNRSPFPPRRSHTDHSAHKTLAKLVNALQ